jgi:hypothetical protein
MYAHKLEGEEEEGQICKMGSQLKSTIYAYQSILFGELYPLIAPEKPEDSHSSLPKLNGNPGCCLI